MVIVQIGCQIYTDLMNAVWGGLLLPITLLAQTFSAAQLMDRLSDDLLALSSLPGLPEGSVVVNPLRLAGTDLAKLKAVVKAETPMLDSAMERFAAHAAERYDRLVIPWSLAYVLTSTLAGANLPADSAKLLVASILSSLDSAFVCYETSRPRCLENSVQFRLSVTSAHHTLLALGISRPNVRTVIENLILAGDRIVHPQGSFFRPL